MTAKAAQLTALERSVVETVAYSDLFDYPLTVAEIHRYLVGQPASRAAVAEAVESLVGRFLGRHGDHVFVAGRDHVVRQRRCREQACRPLWRVARRYAHCLSRLPYVRMVAICGSLAVDNADQDGDIDVFCIAAPGRLWWVQVAAMLLRRRRAFASHGVCPNYFLSLEDLRLQDHDLYAAREVVQAVPLTGSDAYERFVAANDWLQRYLPNAAASNPAAIANRVPRGRFVAMVERIFSGRVGGAVDRLLYALLLRYYALRLRPPGVSLRQLRRYYRRDRQLVVGGGYTDVIRARFADRLGELLGDAVAAEVVTRLLPAHDGRDKVGPGQTRAPRVYGRQFQSRYGVQQ